MEINKCIRICEVIEKVMKRSELPFLNEINMVDFFNQFTKLTDYDEIGNRTIEILTDDIFYELRGLDME